MFLSGILFIWFTTATDPSYKTYNAKLQLHKIGVGREFGVGMTLRAS